MIPHILVIDDQISLPRFIAMELRAEGYQVSVNSDNELGLSIRQALNADLVVLNWELRRGSGSDIYRELRLMNQQVPIVVLTTKDENGCRSALERGAQACLTKPFLMGDLLKAIEDHLKCKQQKLDV